MSQPPVVAFRFATRGVVSALDPVLLSEQSLARMTNGRLHRQLPRTRFKMREIPIDGPEALVPEWRTLACQGASFYNPAKGQGAQTFGKDQAQIVEASDGRKFNLIITGRGSATRARLAEQTGAVPHDPYVHLVWWCQAENYLLCCDGASQLWIWDGQTAAFGSQGLNQGSKEDSMLPNACTAMVYIHYRVSAVTEARRIYVGDGLHKSDQSTAANLIKATEQVYFDTGQWFSPPSSMGNILAGAPLPLRNTQHGHAELLYHCEDGVFSLITNLPRNQWSTQALTKHVLLKTGAVGPYALDLMDGDQVFRSRHGIQTIRSAAAEATTLLNTFAPINGEIADMFYGDHPAYLRFTALANATAQRRLYCTVYPMLNLRYRWSKGFVALNLNPTDVVPDGSRSWEGIYTLPPQWGGVVQFVNGIFAGEERTFIIAWSERLQRKTLVEITMLEGDDEMEDGTPERISCQVWTKAISTPDLFSYTNVATGRLFLKNVQGELDWGVWYRADGEGEWRPWRTGKHCVQAINCSTLTGCGGADVQLPLGQFPAPDRKVRYIQLMVRWKGIATVESVLLEMQGNKKNDNLEELPSNPTDCRPGELALCNYSDFEYSDPVNRWEATTSDS